MLEIRQYDVANLITSVQVDREQYYLHCYACPDIVLFNFFVLLIRSVSLNIEYLPIPSNP